MGLKSQKNQKKYLINKTLVRRIIINALNVHIKVEITII